MSRDYIENRIRDGLKNSVQNIDPETKQRLLEIRRHALNQPAKTSWFKSHQWVPAAGLAFCSIIAVMLMLPSHQSPLLGTASSIDKTARLEIIDNTDDMDTLSDPGFYLWLDETAGT